MAQSCDNHRHKGNCFSQICNKSANFEGGRNDVEIDFRGFESFLEKSIFSDSDVSRPYTAGIEDTRGERTRGPEF